MSKPNTHAKLAAMDIIVAIKTDTWDYVRCAERIQDAIDKSILETADERNGYPKGWSDFALQLKAEAGWKCERCQHPHDVTTGHVLTVHHLTGNKQQPFSDRWAFAVLCQRCHLTVQARVKMDQGFFEDMLPISEWFKPHLEGYRESLKEAANK